MDGRTLPSIFTEEPQVNVYEEVSGAMDSGSYFTDLMSTDHSALAASQAPAAAKAPQKRTKNFSDKEDKLLVSAWLNVSMDAIQGVDQSRTTYWKRIHDYFYVNNNFHSDRTQGSLMNRWSGIQHDVNVFAGCLSKIEARNQSGVFIDDKIAEAEAMFEAEDKQHRNFPYMQCWKILKDKPKWMDRPNHNAKKQKISANSSPSSPPSLLAPGNVDEGQLTEKTLERHAGNKEKQKLRQSSTIELLDHLMEKKKEADADKELKKQERCNKAFALQEESIKLEREKFKFERDHEEDRIMNLDLSAMSYRRQQYYERRQDEIIARHLNI